MDQKFLFRSRFVHVFEQARENFEAGSGDVAKLTLVKFVNRVIEGFENFEALGSDMGDDDAAVVGLALASDEAALFHAVEEAGDVGIARDHSIADAAAGKAAGFGTAEDAKDIILSAGEAGVFEELVGLLDERVSGFDDKDKGAVG